MLHVPSYQNRWDQKRAWYRTHGILPHEEGGGENGTLVISRDEENGSTDSTKIIALIESVLE